MEYTKDTPCPDARGGLCLQLDHVIIGRETNGVCVLVLSSSINLKFPNFYDLDNGR